MPRLLKIRRCFPLLAIALFVVPILALVLVPKPIEAARECPQGPGWILDPSQNNACLLNGQRVGGALDPATAGFTCTGALPMLVSGSPACVNVSGQVVNPQTGAPAATQSPTGSARVQKTYSEEACGLLSFSFGRCFWNPLMKWVGASFLYIGGTLLHWAGSIFNWLITYVIVQFGTTIQTLKLIDGIHSAWSVLRDISNILIIGMFTFIAISIIIGNHTFGEKKLVAKVLVVAVLINFSLLFAKIIIDSSNFIAYQVYKSMAQSAGANANIANRFLAASGITKAFNTKTFDESLRAGQEQTQNATGQNADIGTGDFYTASQGFFHGLIGGIMLLFAAGVLLYGSYLIVARALLLVFLMLVSALAFATYLIPQFSGGEYGWSTWWKSLINASVFGPLLMILLYVSLVVITKMPSATQASPDSWLPLFSLAMGIGMLYISFKVANSFAGKIAGFSMAGMMSMTPVVGTSRLTGLGLRSSVGRFATWRQGSVKQAMTDRVSEGKAPRWTQMYASRLYGNLSKSKLDLAGSKLGTMFGGVTHAPKFGSDWGKGGYAGVQKRKTEHAVHVAADNVESQDSARARGHAKGRDEAVEKLEAQKSALVGRIENLTQGRAQVGDFARNEAAKHDTPSVEQIARDATAEHVRSETRERHQISGEGADRIDRARNAAAEKAVQQSLETSESLEDLEAQVKKVSEALHDLKTSPLKDLASRHKDIEKAGEHMAHAAHSVEQKFAESLTWLSPATLVGDNRAFKGVSDEITKHGKTKKLKEAYAARVAAEQEAGVGASAGGGHGGDAHAAPAPNATAATGHAAPPAAATGGDHGPAH